ncbi:hypothetical protein TIFTF001_041781 [Ficus carica]|uniref:Uncharacterized protein n=1 Tax=Ficus carica TaxID=3494 RepID=A0AA87ZIM6_FICCA|nr:hypothetical protein TIFTF001_041781 [Ficus carica]
MDEATTMAEAIYGFVAWPKILIELETSMNKVSREPSHVPNQVVEGNKCPKKRGKKPANSQTEIQQDAEQQRPSFDFNKMNMELRPLAYYALSSMHDGRQIEVPIPYTISGADMPAFLNFDDIHEFITFQEISANCILVYLRYLEKLCVTNKRVEKFVFVSPTLISLVKKDTPDADLREQANALVTFLRNTPKW